MIHYVTILLSLLYDCRLILIKYVSNQNSIHPTPQRLGQTITTEVNLNAILQYSSSCYRQNWRINQQFSAVKFKRDTTDGSAA